MILFIFREIVLNGVYVCKHIYECLNVHAYVCVYVRVCIYVYRYEGRLVKIQKGFGLLPFGNVVL